MYSIIENYNYDTERIIATVSTSDDFLTFVKNKLQNLDYTFVDNTSADDILKNKSFVHGAYLIRNNNTISYIEKTKVIDSGYVYNTYKDTIISIHTWKLVPHKIFNKKKPVLVDREIDIAKIKKLDMNDIGPTTNITIVAKRGCGKSLLVKNILEKFDADFIKNSLIISPTEKLNPFYGKYFDSKIEYAIDINIINSYIENENSGAVILDDCISISAPDYFYDTLNKLLSSNKLVIIVAQYPFYELTKINTDYYFLFKEDFFTNQKKLYNMVGGQFPYFSLFKEYLSKLTVDYGCMVINTTIASTNMFDQMKYYRVPM